MADAASPFDRSRIVALAKLVLPLSALGLMSMIFLLADSVDPSRALTGAGIDVEDRARDPRLSAARFAGVTEDGSALRIEAGAARSDPGASLRFQVEDFALWLDAPPAGPAPDADAGPRAGDLTAQAAAGLIDRARGTFEMTGGLRVQASPGYDLTAASMAGALDTTRIDIAGPVQGLAPAGRIAAGTLSVTAVPGADGSIAGHRLVFAQGVRLIYAPED